MRWSRIFSSVPLPAPDVPVMTTTSAIRQRHAKRASAVEEADQFSALAVGELCSRHVLRRIAEDLLDLDAAVLQVLFQLGSADADVVRALERFHPLVERADRCLGLDLGGHHERRSLTTDTRGSSVYVLWF